MTEDARERNLQGEIPIMHECRGRCLEPAMRSDGSKPVLGIVPHDKMHLDSRNVVPESFLIVVRRKKERGCQVGEKKRRRIHSDGVRRLELMVRYQN